LPEPGHLIWRSLKRNRAIEIIYVAAVGRRVGRASRRAPGTCSSVASMLGQQRMRAH